VATTSRPDLRIDWATHEAAEHACKRWHYSGCMPAGKTVKVGAWEGDRFIGVVIFSRGATPQIGSPYNLQQTEVCELTRVALRDHVTPVSRIVAIAIRFLRRQSPGLRLIVSYADREQGHHGGIYQAGNWIYVGTTKVDCSLRIHGEVVHRRSVYAKYGHQGLNYIRQHVDPKAERVFDAAKHKYLMPLDDDTRAQVEPLRKQYPKRPKQAAAGSTGAAAGQHRPGRSNSIAGGA